MKILDTPIRSISELKKAPMEIIEQARTTGTGVYILNHNKDVGVILSSEQYKRLLLEKEDLEEQILDLEVKNRLLTNKKMYSDVEVRGESADVESFASFDDDWE
ncbi:type II toxin-antitoxin system Phd/YefM family antitoxin [Enterococcus termitis]|uniref:Antitoxin n=1 Tax=Enterococcus termitis TaxID=332950 RepID=A0A1E5H4X1_9ENTE|nr:type II toxin-antitoxin system Phd/YefM family antitoxin [Enterococcus termitis]OEG20009.1 hypothetical protein BCR25_13955 [Enterococcus termitis]